MTAAAVDWRRNQAAVTAAAFVGFTGFTLVMPFLPLYFEQLGVRTAAAAALWSGVSLGVTPAVTAAMAPVWARVAERYGYKLMVGRSLFSFVVIMALMAWVRAPWQVFALRALHGFFAGYGPIAMTMAAESAPPERVAQAIGWVQTAQRLGPAIGPVIGGSLAQAVGLRRAFLVTALVYLAAFLLVVFGYRETGRPRLVDRTQPVRTVGWAEMRRVPHFVLFMAAIFGLQLVDRSFGPVLPLYLRETGMAEIRVPVMSGLIFTAMAGAAAVGNQATAWLIRRVRAEHLVAGGAVAAAAAGIVFVGGPSATWLVASALVFGLGIGIATTTVYTAATHAVPAADRGIAFGCLTTAYLMALAISPVVAGLLGALGMRVVFLADAIGLAAVGWIVFQRMTASRRRKYGVSILMVDPERPAPGAMREAAAWLREEASWRSRRTRSTASRSILVPEAVARLFALKRRPASGALPLVRLGRAGRGRDRDDGPGDGAARGAILAGAAVAARHRARGDGAGGVRGHEARLPCACPRTRWRARSPTPSARRSPRRART
ncbi:MAG: MFS transporter [Vicinamibacterales bacterium]